jgi:hypothetical protein
MRASGRARAFLVAMAGVSLLAAPPAGAATFASGDVLAGTGQGTIRQFDPSKPDKAQPKNPRRVLLRDNLQTQTQPLSFVTGMCFDSQLNLLATNIGANAVTRFASTSKRVRSFTAQGLTGPESCAYNKKEEVLIGLALAPVGNNNLGVFGISDAQLKLKQSFELQRERVGADWIDLMADQCTVLYTSEGRLVKSYDICKKKQNADFATLPQGSICFALRIRSNGEVLVACRDQIHRLNAAGLSIQSYTPKFQGFPVGQSESYFALNLDPKGEAFWTGGQFTGEIYKVDIATGKLLQSFMSFPLANPATGGNQPELSGLAVVGELRAGTSQQNGEMEGSGSYSEPRGDTSLRKRDDLSCDADEPGSVEFEWGPRGGSLQHSFTSLDITEMTCLANGHDPGERAGWNVFQGTATGLLDGSQPATAVFTLTDNGENGSGPDAGAGLDTVHLQIFDASGNLVLSTRGTLQHGNQNATPVHSF